LTGDEDLASRMVDGIDRFLMHQTELAPEARAKFWHRDFSSPQNYQKSIEVNRQHLAKMLGVVDKRPQPVQLDGSTDIDHVAVLGNGSGFAAYAVHWSVLEGVSGEGVLLVPTRQTLADVVALPDADQTPEMLCGLSPGIAPQSQFARRLAETGCRVLVPMLVDRADTFSVTHAGKATNQPHREFIYRSAYEMGRTPIGYEVQKVLAAIDWMSREHKAGGSTIGIIGYGEGGLIALYAGALDQRASAVCVGGYFDSRQQLWREPIYRNAFGLLKEFGDAEIASLIAPRPLIIEACAAPEISGPPAPRNGRSGAAPGRITTPSIESVRAEVERARELVKDLTPKPRLDLIISGDGHGPFGTSDALSAFFDALDVREKLATEDAAPKSLANVDPLPRLRRQIEEMNEFTQRLMRNSPNVRDAFWARADRNSHSPQKWKQTTKQYRKIFEEELIGHFNIPLLPPNVRTRQIYDEPAYVGYEVVMDVFPDVIASGILLVPRNIKPGERRPVVVCQHGLEGRPRDLADPKIDNHFYHRFACQLAEQGFVAYAPQNPYIFGDRFRVLQRKANPLGKTLFSIIVPQHRQTTEWLASLRFVDPQRIAFYGLSYGGKTAMRVPPLVERYCLSICSGDFNEWVWKCATLDSPYSYVSTNEYDMFEWNLGNTFNYAEMAGLIAPRPFMVERGHHDGVAPDEWVAYEYAKVRLLYSDLHIEDQTSIKFFDGPHTIHGVATFKFLHEKLKF
jgi:dienelactone hydrolase